MVKFNGDNCKTRDCIGKMVVLKLHETQKSIIYTMIFKLFGVILILVLAQKTFSEFNFNKVS